MPMTNPTVLVTRPDADAQRFVAQLRQIAGPFEAAFSPAFSYQSFAVDPPEFTSAIFTSKTGVAFAPSGNGRRAYCVADATADAARKVGYDAVSAGGSAQDLIALILETMPSGKLSHLRGENSRGDVCARLNAAGLNCADVVLYRKIWQAPTPQLQSLIWGNETLLIPLFSAETVSILAEWPLSFSGCTVVAISDVVAQAAEQLDPAIITVADAPNMGSMVVATARMIA